MPHLIVHYTPNLESAVDMDALCRALADTMIDQRDEQDRSVFPIGGVRVLACPAAHYAVADGQGDYGFVYLHLRMGRGRGTAVHERAGRALEAAAMPHLREAMARRPIGVTLQIDEGHEVFDARNSTLHPLFARP